MRTAERVLGLLIVASALLSSTGCNRLSGNKGKIEGKWKLVSISSATESEAKAIESGQVGLTMDFAEDGTLTATLQASAVATPSVKGRYKLLAEDFVELSDFP